MKNIFLLIFALVILNGCAQSTSLVGPTYTMAKSGSILQAGNSFAASYGFKSLTGNTPGEYAFSSFAKSKFTILDKVIEENNKYRSQYELDDREKEQKVVYINP